MSITNKKYYRNLVIVNICLSALLFVTSNCFARVVEFQINCPYWELRFDRAGYIDITNWYYSPRHNIQQYSLTYHEMMTGDWAAAVWYQGIAGDSNQAQWLTDQFWYPFFDTNKTFDFNQPPSQAYYTQNSSCNPVWTDPCQPNPPPYNPLDYGVQKIDSGWSDVNDGKLQVKIYYEVVDLGANGYSLLSFRDPNGNPVYVYSGKIGDVYLFFSC